MWIFCCTFLMNGEFRRILSVRTRSAALMFGALILSQIFLTLWLLRAIKLNKSFGSSMFCVPDNGAENPLISTWDQPAIFSFAQGSSLKNSSQDNGPSRNSGSFFVRFFASSGHFRGDRAPSVGRTSEAIRINEILFFHVFYINLLRSTSTPVLLCVQFLNCDTLFTAIYCKT